MREGWKYNTFGEIGTFLRGKSIQKADFVEHGLPCIHYGQIHTKFGVSVDKHMSEIPEDVYNKSIIASPGDVIIAITSEDLEGSCKSTAWLGDYDVAVSSHAAVYKHNLNPKFIVYYLRSKSFYIEKEKYARGFKVMEIKPTDIARIPIPVPSEEIQSRVVSELDKINELIRLKKEQLIDYDNLAQSIFNEMFGDPVENEKGWEVKKIGEVCLIERGGSPRPIKDYITEDEDGLNWIKIGDAQEGSIFINSTKEKIRKEGLKKTRMVHKGDFILSNSMSFGRPYIMGVDGCIHDGWLVLHDTNNTFNKLYLYYSLAHKSMYQQFKLMAVGGVVNNLNSEMVRRVLVLVPPLIVQQEFANRIELIEMQKKQIISTIQDLETLLASRMQYWFD